MEVLTGYFILFLTHLEEGRNKMLYLTSKLLKENGINFMHNNMFENKLRSFNPLTLITAFFLLFFVLRFILNKFKALWRKFSKYSIIFRFN